MSGRELHIEALTAEQWSAIYQGFLARAVTSKPPLLHMYWPNEFPIALCGHLSPKLRLEPQAPKSNAVCAECKAVYARPRGFQS